MIVASKIDNSAIWWAPQKWHVQTNNKPVLENLNRCLLCEHYFVILLDCNWLIFYTMLHIPWGEWFWINEIHWELFVVPLPFWDEVKFQSSESEFPFLLPLHWGCLISCGCLNIVDLSFINNKHTYILYYLSPWGLFEDNMVQYYN